MTKPQSSKKAGQFEKGRSGNPGGRPKIPEEVKDAARAHTMDAIRTLAEVCRGKKMSPAARVSAATALLDRGWGKPVQTSEISGPGGGPVGVASVPLEALTDEQRHVIASIKVMGD